jgi:hypothetical protein
MRVTKEILLLKHYPHFFWQIKFDCRISQQGTDNLTFLAVTVQYGTVIVKLKVAKNTGQIFFDIFFVFCSMIITKKGYQFIFALFSEQHASRNKDYKKSFPPITASPKAPGAHLPFWSPDFYRRAQSFYAICLEYLQ